MVKDSEWYEKIRVYQSRMYLTGLFNPDDIRVEDKYLAYIAGLFDGEVALGIVRTGRSYSLHISYMKTNYDILKYLSNIFGGSVRRVKSQPYYRFNVWQWYIGAGYAYRTLRKLYPFLRIKKEPAAICIEFFERFWQGYSHKLKPVSNKRQGIGAHYMAQLKRHQSKPGSSKKSHLLYKKIKQQNIISIVPDYAQESDTYKSYRLPNIELPEIELAYIAGLLDAEGSFIIYKISNRPSYLLEMNYRKTDYNTLRYLSDIFGGSVKPAPFSPGNKLDVWLWKLVSARAYNLLIHIYRFLRIKRRAAEICMEFFELYWQGRTTKPVSPERQAIGAKYAALLREYHTKSMRHRRREIEAHQDPVEPN